jgi:hypothetical protein
MALKFLHLIHVCPQLGLVIGLVDLVDHQLGVTSDHQMRNAQPYCDPETSKQAFIFCSVVGGVLAGEG